VYRLLEGAQGVRRSLKIENATHFETRAIRALVAAVHTWAAKDDHRAPLDWLRVSVHYARTWGQAWGCIGRGRMWLYIRKQDSVSVASLAQTIRHELMHNFGYGHSQFYEREVPPEVYAGVLAKWGERLPVRAAVVKPKPPRAERNYQRAVAAERRWATRLKRATTMYRKAKARLRGYERRAAMRQATP
jgi:hypothetical protein